jgi:hypothetical protein
MKNILIPTTLQNDTLTAVKTAINHAAGSNCTITLMLVSEAPDAESASLFLRSTKPVQTALQTQVLENCTTEVAKNPHCRLEVHNRYGLSAPLLKNLLEHLGTNLIIIPSSYKQQRAHIHHYCLGLLANSKIAILHLTEDCEQQEFSKALYLEHATAQLGLQELQQMVSSQFSFKIVSHATIEERHPDELGSHLTEAISKNNINLLIETRKPARLKTKKPKTAAVNEMLGLPMLSICEQA